MNCEKCHKNHATYHLTAIEKGVKREAHLCEECARQAGVGFKLNFTIGDLLGAPPEEKVPKANQVRCPECGITYAEFKAKGRLGCANDYEVFRGELLRLLEKMVGPSDEVITIFFGCGLMEDEVLAHTGSLGGRFGQREIEVREGGQPLYYFIVSVE